MKVLAVSVLAVLSHGVLALPGGYDKPQCGYKPDKCYNAVFHGPPSHRHGLEDAKADCFSFFRATVTPCPVTHTRTSTKYHYANPRTTTVVKSVGGATITKTQQKTITHTSTLSTTITIPVVKTEEVQITELGGTITALATITAYATVTADITITTGTTTFIGPPPRFTPVPVTLIPDPATSETPKTIFVRDANPYSQPRCKPTTSVPHHIPKYASHSCKHTAAYSSACSCLGIKHSTKTLAAQEILLHKTTTKTLTPTITATSTTTCAGVAQVTTLCNTIHTTSTKTVTYTAESTSTLLTTKHITGAAATITLPITTTNTKTITNTILTQATQYACPIMQSSGPMEGRFLHAASAADEVHQFLIWVKEEPSDAPLWGLDAESQLVQDGRLVLVSSESSSAPELEGPLHVGPKITSLVCQRDDFFELTCHGRDPATLPHGFVGIDGDNGLYFGAEPDGVEVRILWACPP